MTAALEVRGVEMRFGALMAVSRTNLRVSPGERRALIGPNGAGKTTMFNIISGELKPTAGEILLFGTNVTGMPPNERARQGLGRTFQRNNVFLNLTAAENVRLAVQIREGLCTRFFRPAASFAAVNDEADAILQRVGMGERGRELAAELSYGEVRQLELALALATRPRVLLLDEPTAGMSPAETTRMVSLLQELPRETTLVIIEHDMDVVQALADYITVLHHGEVLTDGPAAEVRANPQVQAVYLGQEHGEVGARADG